MAVPVLDEILRIYSLFDMGKSLMEMYKGKFNTFKSLFIKAFKSAVDNVLKRYSNESARTFLKNCREIGDISDYENLYEYLCKINNDMEVHLADNDIKDISNEITRQLNCLVLNNNEYKLLCDLLSYHQLNNISFRLNELNEIITCLFDSINNNNNLKSDNHIFARAYNERLCMHSVGEISISLSDIFVMPNVKVNNKTKNILDTIRDFVNNKNQHIFFLEGFGGYGKSSIVSYLAYYYLFNRSSTNIDFLIDRQLVVIRLRDIKTNHIISEINHKLNNIGLLSQNAVIIFDGLDELCLIENKSGGTIISEIIISEFLKYNRKIIITSRPTYVKYDELDISPKINYFKAELTAFNREKRIELVDLFVAKDNNYPLAAKYIKELNIDNDNDSIYGSPFLLYLILSGGIEEDEKDNSWKLLHRIFYKEMFKPMYNPSGHQLSKYNIDKIYQYNCDIAYEMFKKRNQKLSFTYEELSKLLPEYDSHEYVKKSHGLFSYMRYNNGAVEFVHNHVRDFFVCEKILRTMSIWYKEDYTDENIALELGNLLKYASFETQVKVFIKEALGENYKNILEKCTTEHLPNIFDLFYNADGILNYNYFSEAKCYQVLSKNTLSNAAYIYKIIYLNNSAEYINWFSKTPVQKSNILSFMSDDFERVNLMKANLSSLGFNNSDFKIAYLVKANFEKANLFKADFRGANLKGADLREADLKEADLSGADLREADLSEADLRYAKLIGANLSGAKLIKANLSGTDFRGVYFKSACLSGADLSEADLRGADLSETNINGAKAFFTKYNMYTKFCKGFMPRPKCYIFIFD